MKFSCIIPAYNEWPCIANVLWVVLACDELDEIIVVDDGSTDNTWSIIDTFDNPKLQKIHLERNQWKMNAFFIWFERTSGTHIVMIDADFLGLLSDHITELISPVRTQKVDSTMMMWNESLCICKLLKHDLFSWMRVLPRGVFTDKAFFLSGSRFALEAKINEVLYKNKMSVLSLYFPEIHNPSKWWKQILWKQPRDILGSISFLKLIRQAWYIYKQQP